MASSNPDDGAVGRRSEGLTATAAVPLNEVRLRGRWQGATQRDLPSGDVVVTGRLVVPRPEGGVDTVDCAAWGPGLRRRVLGWGRGSTVEVTGSLRRRFWRTPSGAASRYEVEVRSGRQLRRADATNRARR